jgi:hypothetical protein
MGHGLPVRGWAGSAWWKQNAAGQTEQTVNLAATLSGLKPFDRTGLLFQESVAVAVSDYSITDFHGISKTAGGEIKFTILDKP